MFVRSGGGLGDLPAFLAPLADWFVTSPFGPRAAGNHAGIDLRAAVGTPVYAAAAGRVDFAGVQSGYGNIVVVNHGAGVVSKYAHLSLISVAVGQSVNAGETLGLSGATGNVTGPHLHFEVDVNGAPVDPYSSILGPAAPATVAGDSATWDESTEDFPTDEEAAAGGLSPLVIAGLVAAGALVLFGGDRR